MNTIKMFEAEVVKQTINVLVKPGDVFEIRALNAITSEWKKPHTVQGYFNSADAVLLELPKIVTASGIYITLNPVNPALLNRAMNRLADNCEKGFATSDKDIPRRGWLLIDCDPTRPAYISSTGTEMKASVDRAVKIYKFLESHGWGKPVSGYSGNGFHLLYVIDLLADDNGLVQKVLKALGSMFSDDIVTIDQAVFNPSRITKLYGTKARKGDDTTDRPHRMTYLRDLPPQEERKIISREMLEEIAAYLPENAQAANKVSVVKDTGAFNLQSFISKHNIQVHNTNSKGNISIYSLESCPWGSQHGSGDKAGDSCLMEFDNGALAFKCLHSTCAGRKWQDFRNHYESAYKEYHNIAEMPPVVKSDSLPVFISASELSKMTITPKKFIVHGIISDGLTFLCGKPKMGKSWLSLQIALAVALGRKVLGSIDVVHGTVLYLALEDGQARIQDRLRILLNGADAPNNLHFIGAETGWKVLDKGGLEWLQQSIELFGDVKLIIIDTLQKVKPAGRRNKNSYENDYSAVGDLQKLAISKGIGIVLVHHLRKSGSVVGDAFDEISGSLGLTGCADTNIIISRARSSEDAVLSMTSRDATEKALALKFDSNTCQWTLIGEASEVTISREREEILEVMRTVKGDMDAKEILGGLEQMGVRKNDSTLRWHLLRMADDGLLIHTARGKYRVGGCGWVSADDTLNHPQTNNLSSVISTTYTDHPQTKIDINMQGGIERNLFSDDAEDGISNVSGSVSGPDNAGIFVCWSNSASETSAGVDDGPLFD